MHVPLAVRLGTAGHRAFHVRKGRGAGKGCGEDGREADELCCLSQLNLDEDGKTASFQTGWDRSRVLGFHTELIFKRKLENSVSSPSHF